MENSWRESHLIRRAELVHIHQTLNGLRIVNIIIG
jgi:hypothetical protein